MEVFLVLLAIIGVCLIVIKIGEEADYNSQREYNGKRYRWEIVGMDVDKSHKDNIKMILGEISQQEYKRRHNSHQYAVYAWVEVGKQPYTWKEDPINRDIFLRNASEHETLPAYLQKETGCRNLYECKKKKNSGLY